MRLIDADELRIEIQRAGLRTSCNSAFNKLLLKVFDEAVSECEDGERKTDGTDDN